MTKEMTSVEQAVREACGEVQEAAKSEQFMVAVWKVDGGRIELANVTTHRFPVGDFLPAVGHLALQCHEETMRQNRTSPPATPLPRFPGLPSRFRQPPSDKFGIVKGDGEGPKSHEPDPNAKQGDEG